MEKKNQINNKNYSGNYSDAKLWKKLSKYANEMGKKLVYNVLVLYYAMMQPDVPLRYKAEIVGALGYVILPTDLIPDFIPVGGFADDLAAVAFAVNHVISIITPEVKGKASEKVRDIFGTTDSCDLAS